MARRLGIWFGASWRLLLMIAFIAVAIVGPLAVVHRESGCTGEGERETRWTLAAPFSGEPSEGCREIESGLEVLLDEAGLR